MNEHIDEVFCWILKGSIEWYKTRSLKMPSFAQEEMDKYISELDIIGDWIQEKCMRGGQTNRTELFKSFKSWCEFNEQKCMLNSAFFAALQKKRFVTKKVQGKRFVSGLSLAVES